MAGDLVRPSALTTERTAPVASEFMVVDNGVTVAKSKISDVVKSGFPLASQSEAEVGTNAAKAMTPLTTKQAIAKQAVTGVVAGDNVTIGGTANSPIINASAELAPGNKGDMVVVDPTSQWRRPRWYPLVSGLLADDGTGEIGMGYSGSSAPVVVGPGDIVEAQGFRYSVAASGASDEHLATAGGVKLYVAEATTSPDMLGAVGGAFRADDGEVTASSATFVSASATFSSDDVGKSIFIHRAGTIADDTRPGSLITTISAYVDANTVTLADAATTAATGTKWAFGTDETSIWQTLVALGRPILPSSAAYLITEPLGGVQPGVKINFNNAAIYGAYPITSVSETDGTESFFFLNDADDVEIKNGTLEWFGNFEKYLLSGIFGTGNDMRILDMDCSGFPGYGARIGSYGVGEPEEYTTKRPLVQGNRFHHNRQAGLNHGNTESLNVGYNTFDFNGLGAVGAVPADSSTGYGVAGGAGTYPKDVLIIGNRCNDNYRKGIDFHAGLHIKVIGNWCLRNKVMGIYAEDTFITGDVLIHGNTIGEMTWGGTIASGVPGEGSSPSMMGIHVGAQVGQGASAAPTTVIIEGNIIRDFTQTAEGSYPIFAHAGGWSLGYLRIANNDVQAGTVTALMSFIANTSGDAGVRTDFDICNNAFHANETTGVMAPINIGVSNSRKKVFADNVVLINTVASTAGVVAYGGTSVTGKSWRVHGNDITAPASAWSSINDAIRIFRSPDECVHANLVNGAPTRDWDGYRYVARGAQISPTTGAPALLAWFAGDIWHRTNTPASGAPGAICTTAGTPGTWKTLAAIST